MLHRWYFLPLEVKCTLGLLATTFQCLAFQLAHASLEFLCSVQRALEVELGNAKLAIGHHSDCHCY